MKIRLHNIEKYFLQKGFFLIGADEVGRGSVAGPVVAASVCIDPVLLQRFPKEYWRFVNDSKKVDEKWRAKIARSILKTTDYVTASFFPAQKIDRYGIRTTATFAIKESISKLLTRIKTDKRRFIIFIDGVNSVGDLSDLAFPYLKCKSGDALFLSIQLASIVAKFLRDELMRRYYNKLYPYWRFAENKGYGTPTHKRAIQLYGLTPIHRLRYLTKQPNQNL